MRDQDDALNTRLWQAGDIVCFDPDTVSDRATYTSLVPSVGYKLVMVNG